MKHTSFARRRTSGLALFKLVVFLLALIVMESPAHAQDTIVQPVPQNVVNPIDLIDVIAKLLGKTGPPRSSVPVPFVQNVSLLPIVGYGPANGFVIGAAAGITELLGDPKSTQLSSALLSATITTKKQVLLCLRTDIFLKNDEWYITGDIRFLFFAQPTYGLGIYGLNSQHTFNVGGTDVGYSVLEQPMRYNYVRVYESVVKRVVPHFFVGLGVDIDWHFAINDQNLFLDTPNPQLTSHYIYSKKYGFDTAHYSANGLSAQFIFDTRDNTVNAYKGMFANVSFRANEKIFGGSQNSGMFSYDLRKYIPLQKSRPGHVLAFWSWGDFITGGNMPYLALPSITWDAYSRSGRGYIQGRFRGKDMMYGEMEYRLPITNDGFFGAVAFINATTASNPITGQPLFAAMAPGYGAGIRIKLNKKDRTNICVDYGLGQSSSGLYFNIREVF